MSIKPAAGHSFLFCTSDIPHAKLDGQQFAKVQEFRQKIQAAGCLTREFVDEASLINAINLILDRFANSWKAESKVSAINLSLNNLSGSEIDAAPDLSKEDTTDDGLFDVLEKFEKHNGDYTGFITQWGDKLQEIASATTSTTENISQLAILGKPEQSRVREVLSPLTTAMENFAQWCEDKMLEMDEIIDKLSDEVLLIIDLSRDVEESKEEIISAKESIEHLMLSIDEANESIVSFSNAVEGSPRLDKKLDKANRRVVTVHRRLVEKNRIFKDNLELGVHDLRQRIEAMPSNPQETSEN